MALACRTDSFRATSTTPVRLCNNDVCAWFYLRSSMRCRRGQHVDGADRGWDHSVLAHVLVPQGPCQAFQAAGTHLSSSGDKVVQRRLRFLIAAGLLSPQSGVHPIKLRRPTVSAARPMSRRVHVVLGTRGMDIPHAGTTAGQSQPGCPGDTLERAARRWTSHRRPKF